METDINTKSGITKSGHSGHSGHSKFRTLIFENASFLASTDNLDIVDRPFPLFPVRKRSKIDIYGLYRDFGQSTVSKSLFYYYKTFVINVLHLDRVVKVACPCPVLSFNLNI